MTKLAPRASACAAAATGLGPEDTARFLELHDSYSDAGLAPMDAARKAAADLVAEIKSEAADLTKTVAALAPVEAAPAETRSAAPGDQAEGLTSPTAESLQSAEDRAAAATKAEAAEQRALAARDAAPKRAGEKAEKDRRAAEILAEREAAKKAEVDAAAETFELGQEARAPVDRKVNAAQAAGQGDVFAQPAVVNDSLTTQAVEQAPAQAEPVKADALAAEKALWKRITAGEAGVDEFKAGFEAWVSGKDEIVALLTAKKKDDLLSIGGAWFASRYKSENKPEVVDALWRDGLSRYALGRGITYGMGVGSYERAVRAMVDATGTDELAAYAAERKAASEEAIARVAQMAEAVKDPKTLDDYKTWMRATMTGGKTFAEARMMLTPEQRATFDDLAATDSRASRKTANDDQRTRVAVAGQTVDGDIIATKHTKKGHDLFVVKLAERVSREDYDTLNAGAKKIGGYYSSYRGGGAIPGFQFTAREQAQAFVKLAGGDATDAKAAAQDRRDAFADDRSQTAAQRLTEMADRLDEQADESLGRERKANTERRARFAEGAEAAARSQQAMAKTMRNLAEAIEGGTAKFLDRVRQKVQVELLQTYVATAQGDQLRAKYDSYSEQEKHRGEAPTTETADHATFPTFTAFRSDLASLARQLIEVDGTKLLGQRLMKMADDTSEAFAKWAREPANLHKIATFSTKSGTRPSFGTKDEAERVISRSGYKGKAIPWHVKRGEHTIVMSPSEAVARGLWDGDGDKRITLDPDLGAELVEKIGKASRRGAKVSVPWQLETAHDRRKALARMGIETPAEFRAALREFIGLREQAAAPDKVKQLERALIGRKNDGFDFFPTPESVADEMVDAAGIEEGMSVLEPNAGMGHIADRVRAAGHDVDVIEIESDKRDLLEAKGYRLIGRDFLDIKPREFFTFGDVFSAPDGTVGVMRGLGGMGSNRVRLVPSDGGERVASYHDRDELKPVEKRGTDSGYDRILMNPPFSDGRDIAHVRHAYDLLKPGGRLVAIMGESAFTNQNKRATEFRDWLDEVGGTEEKLPAGTFNDPSLPVNTGANARMVVIEKGDSGHVALFSRTMGDQSPVLQALSDNDELFALPQLEGKTVNEIAFDLDPAIKVLPQTPGPGQTGRWRVTFPEGGFADISIRKPNPYGQTLYGSTSTTTARW
jgi:hypothetical protein